MFTFIVEFKKMIPVEFFLRDEFVARIVKEKDREGFKKTKTRFFIHILWISVLSTSADPSLALIHILNFYNIFFNDLV